MDTLVDDFSDDFTTTGVLELDDTATGTIEVSNDSDWFAIELTAGDVVRIAANSPNANLVLRNADGIFVAFDVRDTETNENVIFAQISESGTYYVDVSSFGSPLDYTLTASLVDDDFANFAATTGVLEVGGTTSGEIDFTNDSDWLAIELTAGETVRIGSGSFDVRMGLRDEYGNFIIADQQSFDTNENFILANVDSSGTYYLDVRSFVGNPEYTISATVLEDDFAGDTGTTGVLETDGTATGTIDYEGDADWFAIDLTAGETVRITSDTELVLRDGFANIITFGEYDFNTGEYFVLAQVDESETYFVEASGFTSPVAYTLTATELVDDFAGNAATTGVLEIDGTVSGAIEYTNDRDWFAITLTAGETVRVATANFDTDFALRDAAGNFLNFNSTDYNTNENFLLAQVAESGTYYIDVGSYTSPLDYTFSATLLEDDFAGTPQTTGTLETGGTASGTIDFRDDRDWFAINIAAGETVRIAVDSTDAYLYLLDNSGNFVESYFTDFDTNENVIIFQNEESGTFYVDVSTFNDTLDYTLSATTLDDDFAGNIGTAGVLEIGSTTSGTIDFRNDADWFAIDLSGEETIRITLDRSELNFRIIDAQGNSPAASYYDFDTDESVIVVPGSETGTFYVDVSGFDSPTDYTLTTSIQEDDFSNTIDTTGVLTLDGTTSGTINYESDEDWFELTITDTDQALRLSVDNFSISLNVYDQNGVFFAFADEGNTIIFSETGTYYVAANSFFSNSVDYTITSRFVDTIDVEETITGFGFIDTVVDEANEIAYSLTDDGTLHRYDYETESPLPNVDLGTFTNALTLSQDGQYLFAAETELSNTGNGVYEATVLRINTDTLAVESFSFEVTGNGYNITDIQAAADGSVFVTTNFPGSGWVPLYNLSGFDTVFSAETVSDPAFIFGNEVRQSTTLDISRDGNYLLLAESNSSAYPVHIYSVEDSEVIATVDHGGFNDDRNAISGEANLVAISSYNQVTVYDFDLNPVMDLTGIFGNATRVSPGFSRNGEYLFLMNEPFDGEPSVAVVNTTTFDVIAFVELPQTSILTVDELDISPDGLSLIVTNFDGVFSLDFSDSTFSVDGTENADVFAGDDYNEIINGLAGDDIIDGLGGADELYGGTGNDDLDGGAGADRLDGGSGDDTLFGGTGTDTLIGGTGDDVIDGWTGVDTVLYTGLSTGVSVDLDITTAQDTIGAGIDTLVRVENVIGSGQNDTLSGNAGRNRLEGNNGDDVIDGRAGNDTLLGGSGADILTGGTGADQLFGGNDGDMLYGGSGNDTLNGAAGNDRLDGGSGNDSLFGGTGVDTLIGGAGNDVIDGWTGVDTALYTGLSTGVTVDLDITTAQDTIGAGVDTLLRVENLIGSGQDDTLSGNAGNNRLEGSNGDDVLDGRDGNDTLLGGSGADTLTGGTGADRLYGGNDNDTLFGGDGRDRLDGGAGDDTFFGGDDRDLILGGDGDDTLHGEGGADVLFGGAGADSFVFTGDGDTNVGPFNRDEIRDFSSADGDRIVLQDFDADTTTAGLQNFTFAANGFTGTAGEIQIQELVRSGVDIRLVSFDTDGDAQADAQIWVLTDDLDFSDFDQLTTTVAAADPLVKLLEEFSQDGASAFETAQSDVHDPAEMLPIYGDDVAI